MSVDPGFDGAASRELLTNLSQIRRTLSSLERSLEKQDEMMKRLRDQMRKAQDAQNAQARQFSEEMKSTRTMIEKLRQDVERNENKADARAKMERLDSEIKRRYGRWDEVRSFANGLIDELGDAAIRNEAVDREVLRQFADLRVIKNTDYWLALAIASVVAEYTGDTRRHATLLSLASVRDKAKTSLFLALFYPQLGAYLHRRENYEDSGALHMFRYLESLDPDALGREFFSVLEALSRDELGPKALSYARETLRGWMEMIETSQAVYETQRAKCKLHLLNYHTALPSDGYPTLRELADDQWERITEGWKHATACAGAAAYLHERFAVVRDGSVSEREYTQRALHALINSADSGELQIRRDIYLAELTLEHDGNQEAALSAFASHDPYATGVDFPTLLTLAAFNPKESGIGPQAQQFALACASDWIGSAGRAVIAQARSARPTRVKLRRDGWAGVLDLETGPEAVALVADDWGAHLERLTPPAKQYAVPLGFIAIAGILPSFAFLGNATSFWVIVAVGVLVTGFGAWRSAQAREQREQSLKAAKEEARTLVARAHQEGIVLLNEWDKVMSNGLQKLQESLPRLQA